MEDIVVTSGASDALRLLIQATLHSGVALAMEEPGYPGLRKIAETESVPIIDLPVDAAGADPVGLIRESRQPLVIHLTPSHQFPLGVELSEDRRATFLSWADEAGALIVENDYGGEFRFAQGALPPLASLDRRGWVCFVGTFSRLLAPGLRVGYLVATPPLAERVAGLKRELDDYASLPAQLAVAHLIRSGELERHLRRVRRLADYKRNRIKAALSPIEHVRISGLGGGLHALVEPMRGESATVLAERLLRDGVILEPLAQYYARDAPEDALLLDYSAVSLCDLEDGLNIIADALAG